MTHSAFEKPRLDAVAWWLLFCLALIFAMAVIGAITRLTESGLSIMEWAPIKGSLPPLSQAEWLRLFDLYQQTDEFRIDNAGMDLAGFKTIFWWEWIHRFWGRAMGMVFGIGLMIFWLRGRLPGWMKPCLLIALVLGGLQGTVGWFMVASGFDDGLTDVSHYRLAMHLMFALTLYGYLLWITLVYLRRHRGFFQIQTSSKAFTSRGTALGLVLLLVLIVSGAFVAGKNAGVIYNEWPLMGGDFVPFDYQPKGWGLGQAMMNHDTAIQFNHRWLAMIVALYTVALVIWVLMKDVLVGATRFWFQTLGIIVVCQFVLGIVTLLSGVTVSLGALHQAGAITLLSAYLVCLFLARKSA